MCTLVRKDYKVLTAKKDIVVYKKVKRCYVNNIVSFTIDYTRVETTYRNFEYVIDKLYKTEIDRFAPNISIEPNFDSIDIAFAIDKYNRNYIYIITGFHSFKLLSRCPTLAGYERIARCVIPKGSKYINGFTDIVVSNQIIVKEVLDQYYCNRIISRGKYYNEKGHRRPFYWVK